MRQTCSDKAITLQIVLSLNFANANYPDPGELGKCMIYGSQNIEVPVIGVL